MLNRYRHVIRSGLLVLGTIGGIATSSLAAPARFWVSNSLADPFDLGIGATVGAKASLALGQEADFSIWMQPHTDAAGDYDANTNPFRRLQVLSFNIVATNSSIDLLHGPLGDPLAGVRIVNPIVNRVKRFSTVRDSGLVDPLNSGNELSSLTATQIRAGGIDQINGILAASLTAVEPFDPIIGVGPTCTDVDSASTCAVTAVGPVWRLATFRLQALTSSENAGVRLQIGGSGMIGTTGSSSDVEVIFAPPGQESPKYNAGFGSDRNNSSKETDGIEERHDLQISIATPIAGDYNANTFVDAADYTVWRDNLTIGDYDFNGVVEPNDRSLWTGHFGATSGIGLQADGNRDGTVNAADFTIWRDTLGSVADLRCRWQSKWKA